MGRPREWQQQIGVMDGVGVLVLAHPDGRAATHYFDADLLADVAAHGWCGAAGGYARTHPLPVGGKSVTVGLHQFTLGLPAGGGRQAHVDHLDRNTFDSRRQNLAVKSNRANQANRHDQSIYGVGVTPHGSGFRVRVQFGVIFHRLYCSDLPHAERCGVAVRAIAAAFDADLREAPTKEELRLVRDITRRV